MPLDPITLAIAAVVVIVVALVVWQVVAVRAVSRARDEIVASRARLEQARADADASTGAAPADVARANDRVQQERRAVNAATREGEALRKRFPTSLYAGRIPEPRYEEAGGGTAEPPRIAF